MSSQKSVNFYRTASGKMIKKCFKTLNIFTRPNFIFNRRVRRSEVVS